jgi:hypothetical protein
VSHGELRAELVQHDDRVRSGLLDDDDRVLRHLVQHVERRLVRRQLWAELLDDLDGDRWELRPRCRRPVTR